MALDGDFNKLAKVVSRAYHNALIDIKSIRMRELAKVEHDPIQYREIQKQHLEHDLWQKTKQKKNRKLVLSDLEPDVKEYLQQRYFNHLDEAVALTYRHAFNLST